MVFTCGIDLGTTYSCIAVSKNNLPKVTPTSTGKRTMPSFVTFQKDCVVIGEGSKNALYRYMKSTVYDVKRLIGHKFSEKAVQEDIKHLSYKVINDGRDNPLIEIVTNEGETQKYTPQDISGYILRELAGFAIVNNELPIGTTVNTVITVPAYFNDNQRRATLEAGSKAGLNVLQIINEPTAAAIAYGYRFVKEKANRKILVYDFGGGTFDVSIIGVTNNNIKVLGTDGDTHLGGEDINSILVDYYAKRIQEETDEDIFKNSRKLQRLKRACEEAKCMLSELEEAEVEYNELLENDIDSLLTRSLLDKLCKDVFQKTIDIVARVLKNSNLSKDSIDDIVLIGGSSRIKRVQELLNEFFGRKLNRDINPDEAVAIGASILAEDLVRGTNEKVFDNGAKVLVNDKGEYVGPANEIEPPSSAFPSRRGTKIFIGGKSHGSRTMAGFRQPIVNAPERKILISDILSHSLGMKIANNENVIMLKKGQQYPCEKIDTFFTVSDNQRNAEIIVLQGESKKASENRILYSGLISGLPLRNKGEVQFDVTFSLNANGILLLKSKETTGAVEDFIVTINI